MSITLQFHSFREICITFIWKMIYNFQSNYNYTTTVRRIRSGVFVDILVDIVLLSCNFIQYFVSKFGFCIHDPILTKDLGLT